MLFEEMVKDAASSENRLSINASSLRQQKK
jgi:hypothetical protein